MLRYLKEKKYRDALEYADYLIVQIDMDQCEHPHFGVSQQEQGRPLEPPELVAAVRGRLQGIIGADDTAFYGDRILFAICVREVECWLLPLWAPDKAAKWTGCAPAVDLAPDRANEARLNKDPRRYEAASKDYRKPGILRQKGPQNPSLAIFLEELGRRNITFEDGDP